MRYNKETWNYEHPICFWEELPWQFRWPLGIGAVIYFGGAFLVPLVILLR